jgi:DnaD and phage-associated domain
MLTIKDYLTAGETAVSDLVFDHYHHIGLTAEELLLWLQLYKAQKRGEAFPDVAKIAQQLGIAVDSLYGSLEQLSKKNMLAIDTQQTAQGQLIDRYDLTLLFDRIGEYLDKRQQKEVLDEQEVAVDNVYQNIQQEFGRTLSPIEMQTVDEWIKTDQYAPELIQLALKEAVLNQAYSLKYMDRILLSWERKNIRTKDQVEREQQLRKRGQLRNGEDTTKQSDVPKVPLYNWLDPKKGGD